MSTGSFRRLIPWGMLFLCSLIVFFLIADFAVASPDGLAEDTPSIREASSSVRPTKPNFVFILADDLGFTDLAPYGSEVNTPVISSLAELGLTFTNYHTAANCAPSRAMLLTGVSSHLASVPNIPEMLAPEQIAASPNYRGVLGNDVVTVATLLEDAGYRTYMAGKWHLGKSSEKRPSRRGFSRTVALMDSGADNWEQRPYIPLYEKANWYADGEPYQLPDDFYSSEFLVDKIIEFIDGDRDDKKPFFAYLPFLAVHIPVQAPQTFIDEYMSSYEGGWDVLRERRLAKAIELGIVPRTTTLAEIPTTESWSELSEERQLYEAKRMAVYAAMIEAMDFHIGRLIEYLHEIGEFDNTVFIVTSDNGSEASGPSDPHAFANKIFNRQMGYNTDYEGLGLRGSYNTISPSFASASASPLAYYKFYSGEGGMRVPLIFSGQAVAAKEQGSLTHAFSWATDITPTILSMAGVDLPKDRYAGKPVQRISGRDLTPILSGEKRHVYGAQDAVGYELAGNAALFKGDYKLTLLRPPLGDGEWRLYNIVEDPGETKDLSDEQPARFQSMLNDYVKFQRDNKVLPLPAGYDHLAQLAFNTLKQLFGKELVVLLISVLVFLPFLVAYRIYSR